jgi:hypothetical protein
LTTRTTATSTRAVPYGMALGTSGTCVEIVSQVRRSLRGEPPVDESPHLHGEDQGSGT